MPLSRRYVPEWSPGESGEVGLDFSPILPVGVGIKSGTIAVGTHREPSQDASGDWTIGPVEVRGRALYCLLTGGVSGRDYRINLEAVDTLGQAWPRTGLLLVAATS